MLTEIPETFEIIEKNDQTNLMPKEIPKNSKNELPQKSQRDLMNLNQSDNLENSANNFENSVTEELYLEPVNGK